MTKETYYFPHEFSPTSDPKIVCLLGNYGALGYGIYWRIVEMLHQEEAHQLPLKPFIFEALAKQMLTSTQEVEKMINDCIEIFELFKSDNTFFWSNRVRRNIEEREKKRLVKVKAGRIGGIKSGMVRKKMKQNEAVLEINEAVLEANEANEAKERKGKESILETSSQENSKPKPGKNVYLVAQYYCQKVGKTDETAQLKAAKRLFQLVEEQYPKDTVEQWKEEITGRIDVATKYYSIRGIVEWNLQKVAENWDKILAQWLPEVKKYQL